MADKDKIPAVAIIGGGFCGLMTAINLIEKANTKLHVVLINEGFSFAKGVAFSAHTAAYLLNVPALNMSCFADDLRHFLRWLQQQEAYSGLPENMLERLFVSRKLYGEYLLQTWHNIHQSNPLVTVETIQAKAVNINLSGNGEAVVYLENNTSIIANYIVLATGNEKPADVRISNTAFYQSPNYFGNPWHADAIQNCNGKDVLIIGNGLTMVDTVLGLQEQDFDDTIYSLSPNGFSLLPHISNGVLYKDMLQKLMPPYQLGRLYTLFSKHIRLLSALGLTAEPVIDSVRVKTQEIWAALNMEDKKQFLRRLKYKWGIARHRIPAHIHRKLQQLRIDKKLVCYKAALRNITEEEQTICVNFYNKLTNKIEQIQVGRVINCTGPVSDITRSDNELIQNLVAGKLIVPDPLQLGINATFEGAVINAAGNVSDVLFTLGSHMKGILWESTAVPDLRVQAERLSVLILNKIYLEQQDETNTRVLPVLKTKLVQPLKEEGLIEYYI